ncbi:MAG: hypothetical protein KDM63_11905, partial [Verrucomicrobiae bacterium]|nr:hypothetical protein [Verrucomicrobiae bacterium]
MSDSDQIKLSPQDLMPDWVTNLEKNLHQGFTPREDDDSRGPKRKGGRDDRGGRGRQDRDREPRGRDRREGGGGDRGRRDDRRRDDRGGGNRDRSFKRGGDRDRGRRDDGRHGPPRPHFDDRPPAGVSLSLEPSPETISALARHIRSTGRTYALADL